MFTVAPPVSFVIPRPIGPPVPGPGLEYIVRYMITDIPDKLIVMKPTVFERMKYGTTHYVPIGVMDVPQVIPAYG